MNGDTIHVLSCSTCTGDGIILGQALGADVDYINRRVNMFGPAHTPYHYSVIMLTESLSVFRVDKNGNYLTGNFMPDEESVLVELPGRYSWCIVDAKAVGQ